MGFSVSGATAVVFVGFLVSFATVYPAIDRYGERRYDAMSAQEEQFLTQQNTAIEIEHASYKTTTGELIIVVVNTGARTLSLPETTLLIDGRHRELSGPTTSVAGDQSTAIWSP